MANRPPPPPPPERINPGASFGFSVKEQVAIITTMVIAFGVIISLAIWEAYG